MKLYTHLVTNCEFISLSLSISTGWWQMILSHSSPLHKPQWISIDAGYFRTMIGHMYATMQALFFSLVWHCFLMWMQNALLFCPCWIIVENQQHTQDPQTMTCISNISTKHPRFQPHSYQGPPKPSTAGYLRQSIKALWYITSLSLFNPLTCYWHHCLF